MAIDTVTVSTIGFLMVWELKLKSDENPRWGNLFYKYISDWSEDAKHSYLM